MVGCSSQDIQTAINEMEYVRIDGNQYYEENTELHIVRKEIKEKIGNYTRQNPYNESQVRVAYYDEDDTAKWPRIEIDYSALSVDINGKYLFLHNKMINEIDKILMPGVIDFIAHVCDEKEDLAPQAMVINNNWIIMYPKHLYQKDELMHIAPMLIGLNNFEIKDNYFKRLIESVDTSQFIVHEPLLTEEGAILQLSTPFYFIGGDGEIILDRQSWYGGPNMSFRLYINNDKLEEIHTIIKEPVANQIQIENLSPILEWVKEEWQVDEETINELEEMIASIATGSLKEQEAEVGDLQYTYDIMKRNFNRGQIKELTLKR